MIRFCVLSVILLLPSTIVPLAFAQQDDPYISAAQQRNKTIFVLSKNWTSQAENSSLIVSSDSEIEKARASPWWQWSVKNDNTASFVLTQNANSSSVFVLYSNSTNPRFQYRLLVDSIEYSGLIRPENNTAANWFIKWNDSVESAAAAYVPKGWKADLQIIRPYGTMTGLVFFARDDQTNSLAYVFYPFMPLHLVPDDGVCEELGSCSGLVTGERLRKAAFGSAPISLADVKSSNVYFETEVLPVLRRNLDHYQVHSAQPQYALVYDGENRASSRLIESLLVEYSFDVQGKKIIGKSAILVSNYTGPEQSGFWNGFVIGVESPELDFHQAFQRASVMLLTLQLQDEWMRSEQAVLDENVENTAAPFRNVSALVANKTLADFDSIMSTMAHALVRSYNDTRIGGYEESTTGKEIHLPLFESSDHWFLEGENLVGQKSGRNILNTTTLQPLFL